MVSPGTLTDASYLDAREPAFLMAIAASGSREAVLGAALIDLSTGEFSAAEYHGPTGLQALADEVAVLRPRELVVSNEQKKPSIVERLVALTSVEPAVTMAEGWSFEPEAARRALLDQLKTHGLEGFGLEGRTAAIQAAGRWSRICATRKSLTSRTSVPSVIERAAIASSSIRSRSSIWRWYQAARRAAGITAARDRSDDHVDGGRLLRAWLLRPLCALERIRDRLDAVEELAFRSTERGKFRDTLKGVDLERLIGRVALGTAGRASWSRFDCRWRRCRASSCSSTIARRR